ncbi:hypothetical protein ACFL1G_04175 [Planctomycetota bacterium]
MARKRPDEWITQLNITNRLNEIADIESKTDRRRIIDELRKWTHDFWYQKFKMIRKTLRSKDSFENKCHKIQSILDCPKNWFENLM